MRNGGGISLDHSDVSHGHAQLVRRNLGKRRLMALAVRVGTDQDGDLAVRVYAYGSRFIATPGDADRLETAIAVGRTLDITAQANTEIASVLSRLLLLGPESRVVEHAQGLLQRLPVTAAFNLNPGDNLIGMFLLADHIAQAQLGRVEPQFLCPQVEQAFHDQDADRQAHPTIGPTRGLVGDNRQGLATEGRDLIRASGEGRSRHAGLQGGTPRIGRVGTHVADKTPPHPQNSSLLGQGEFGLHDLLLGLQGRGGQVFAAVFDPFDRAADMLGQKGQQDFLGIDIGFGSKPPADIRGNDPDMVLGKVEQAGQVSPHQMRHLGRGPQCQGAQGWLIVGQTATGFHGQRHMPTGREALGHDAVCRLKCLGNRAGLHVYRLHEIVAPFRMDERGVRLHGLGYVAHNLQGLILDCHLSRGILCRVAVRSHDDRHGFSHEANLVQG